jgi:hypothetical protein
MTPEEILKTASDIAEGKRDANGAENSFNLIADLWTAYLRKATGMPAKLLASDVAQMMALLKIARSVCGAPCPDHYIDQAGYAAWAGHLRDTATVDLTPKEFLSVENWIKGLPLQTTRPLGPSDRPKR